MAPALRAQVARVLVLLDGTLELRLRGGPTVRFGTPEDAERKAVTIRRMLAWAGRGTPLRTLSVVSRSRRRDVRRSGLIERLLHARLTGPGDIDGPGL